MGRCVGAPAGTQLTGALVGRLAQPNRLAVGAAVDESWPSRGGDQLRLPPGEPGVWRFQGRRRWSTSGLSPLPGSGKRWNVRVCLHLAGRAVVLHVTCARAMHRLRARRRRCPAAMRVPRRSAPSRRSRVGWSLVREVEDRERCGSRSSRLTSSLSRLRLHAESNITHCPRTSGYRLTSRPS